MQQSPKHPLQKEEIQKAKNLLKGTSVKHYFLFITDKNHKV